MSDETTIKSAFSWRKVRLTPLRDLLRGRVSGRLDWRGRIDSSKLPADAKALVRRVVKRTRLWKLERYEVADELIAHFTDGLEAGQPVGELIATFGDEKQTAKLIRRAKIRNQSIVWHVTRWMTIGFMGLSICYVGLAILFAAGHPKPTVDYVAQLNAVSLNAAPDQRGWALYRRVILKLSTPDLSPSAVKIRGRFSYRIWPRVLDYNRDGKHWPEIADWMRQHADDVALIRESTARPVLGFILGAAGSIDDHDLWSQSIIKQWTGPAKTGVHQSLRDVMQPDLAELRQLANILAYDAQFATQDRDARRVASDIRALLGMARQLRAEKGMYVNGLVSIGIYAMTLDALDRLLVAAPDLLDDQTLIDLAHELSRLRVTGDLLSYVGERAYFMDMVQRVYTDDGHGDGRITPEGIRLFSIMRFADTGSPDEPTRELGVYTWGPATIFAFGSRREMVAEYNRAMDAEEARLQRPLYETDFAEVDRELGRLRASSWKSVRFALLLTVLPSFQRVHVTGERTLGQSEGLVTTMALNLYRRRHGNFPDALAELVPTFLPSVPADRITGQPLHYKLVDGKPLIYSVGIDRADNGGVPPMKKGRVDTWSAADWRWDNGKMPEGDWVLFPYPRPAELDDE